VTKEYHGALASGKTDELYLYNRRRGSCSADDDEWSPPKIYKEKPLQQQQYALCLKDDSNCQHIDTHHLRNNNALLDRGHQQKPYTYAGGD